MLLSSASKMTNEEYIKKNKIKIVDDDKNTRLHYVCAQNDLESLKKELEIDQKIDPENYLGWTPLMMAVRNGNVEVVKLLLEQKADATKKNKFGISVFHVSVTSGNMEIVTCVLNHLLCGGVSRQHLQRVISPISLAVLFSHMHIFRYLLSQYFDVNNVTPVTELTPLMFAAAVGNTKATKKLKAKNADQTMKNAIGRTAAEIAEIRLSKIDIDISPDIISNKQRSNVPFMMFGPDPCSPCLQLTPYPQDHLRKSSSTLTPADCYTPEMTPINYNNYYQQVFFPPEFNHNQQYITSPYATGNNSMLNQAVYLTPSPSIYNNNAFV